MDRLVRNLPHTLKHTTGGTVTGSVTYVIKDSADVTLLSGTATQEGATNTYAVTLPSANTAVLDTYSVEWTYTIAGQVWKPKSYFEIVGGFYFSISELREFDSTITVDPYTDQKVVNAREKAEEFIEKKTHRSWVPRGARVNLNGTGGRDIPLNYDHIPIRRIVSASVISGGTTDTFDATELADVSISETGFLTRKTLGSWTSGYRNVSLFYEYGENQPPEDIKEAAMLLAQAKLIPTDIQAGVKQLSVEGYSLTYRDGLISSVPGVHDLLEPYLQNYVALA